MAMVIYFSVFSTSTVLALDFDEFKINKNVSKDIINTIPASDLQINNEIKKIQKKYSKNYFSVSDQLSALKKAEIIRNIINNPETSIDRYIVMSTSDMMRIRQN